MNHYEEMLYLLHPRHDLDDDEFNASQTFLLHENKGYIAFTTYPFLHSRFSCYFKQQVIFALRGWVNLSTQSHT